MSSVRLKLIGWGAVLFVWWTFAASQPNIIVEGNVIKDNGLGIYLGWQGEWYILVKGNTIQNNGEGIRIVNRWAMIEQNLIAANVIGIRVTSEHQEELVTNVEQVILKNNVIEKNELYALLNSAPILIEAQGNWWGSPQGPRLLPELSGADSTDSHRWTIKLAVLPNLGRGRSLSLSHTLGCWSPSSRALEVNGFSFFNPGFGEPTIPLDHSLAQLDVVMFMLLCLRETSPSALPGNTVVGSVKCADWLRSPPGEGSE